MKNFKKVEMKIIYLTLSLKIVVGNKHNLKLCLISVAGPTQASFYNATQKRSMLGLW